MPDFVEQLNDLARGFQWAQVVLTANETGLFQHLEEPGTAGEVAQLMGWDPRATRMLLDVLAVTGLIGKNGDCYRNTAEASECLIPGQPKYQGDILNHLRHGYDMWGRLREALENGGLQDDQRDERNPRELRDFILGMQNIARQSAREVLEVLRFDGVRHMLDVGCGPATYMTAFAEANPGMHATGFDLPDVIAIAREQIDGASVANRVDFMEGNYDLDAFGTTSAGGYDLVFVSNIIHSCGPDRCEQLVRKCADALLPGGRLVIKDFLVDTGRTGPPFSMLFALQMLVATGEGDVYTFDQVDQWTRKAGLTDGHARELTPRSHLWIATKV